VRVADATGTELGLVAEAGAIAAIVRQRTPDLLAALANDGWQFTAMRIRVQVKTEPTPVSKQSRNQIDKATLRPLYELARELPRGELRRALEKMLRKIG
jgi:hypothetical protein